MPFGLAFAPAVFQRAMTKILFTLIGSEVVAYLNDILIATETEQRNVLLCTQVMKLLLQAKFFGNKKKCEFIKGNITFLGFAISQKETEIPSN
jgi:Reverse transcriptase (RNA-dependent DNA polymerase)